MITQDQFLADIEEGLAILSTLVDHVEAASVEAQSFWTVNTRLAKIEALVDDAEARRAIAARRALLQQRLSASRG